MPKIERLKEAEGTCLLLGCKIEGGPAVFISGVEKTGLICADCIERAVELMAESTVESDKPPEPA
jgi:hypothetical protein